VDKQTTQYLEMELICRCRARDQALQLECCLQECRVLEKKSRCERFVGVRLRVEPCGIEVEMQAAGVCAELVPLVIFVAGRHECELSREPSERRSRQALDERFSVATIAFFVHHQEVHRRTKAILNLALARGFHEFGRHAAPRHGATSHSLRRRNLDRRMDHVGCRTAIPKGITSRPLIVLVDRRKSIRREESQRLELVLGKERIAGFTEGGAGWPALGHRFSCSRSRKSSASRPTLNRCTRTYN